MTGEELIVRPSRDADVAAIAAIYGHHVRYGVASFEEVPPSVDEIGRRRNEILACGLPYLVGERAGRVVGYCYAGPFRTRSAYRFTLEDSIYMDPAEIRRGIGRKLLQPLIEQCAERGYRQMVAVIGGSETVASIRLHRALGFVMIGVQPATGFKFGRWIDTVLMQRALGPGSDTLPE
jgi:L-amino acid N-acyltransferase YncA